LREGEERPIYRVIGRDISFFGLCAALLMIEMEWRSIVGDALAKRSGPKSFEDGVLVVAVENKSAEKDMNFRKGAILREIRTKASLSLEDMKDIRTEIGGAAKRERPIRNAAARHAGRRIVPADGADLLVSEMLDRNPLLTPELAKIIARCRVMQKAL
jgi:hypothetical protein